MDLHSLGWTVILTAGFSPPSCSGCRWPAHARRHGAGILIAPRSLWTAISSACGSKLEPNPPPGTGRPHFRTAGPVPVQLAGPVIAAPALRSADQAAALRAPAARRHAGGEADDALVEQQHDGDRGRHQHGQSRQRVTAGQGREADGQHKQLGHQRTRPRPAEARGTGSRQRQRARRRRPAAAPSVNTAPQKDSTGAPVTSWMPYQPAATSRAVASAATISRRSRRLPAAARREPGHGRRAAPDRPGAAAVRAQERVGGVFWGS